MNANLLWRWWPGASGWAPAGGLHLPLAVRFTRAWRRRLAVHAARVLQQRADDFARAGNSSYADDLRTAAEMDSDPIFSAAPSPHAGQ